MATLKDVAERAGVSTATVSYVLNRRGDKKVSEKVVDRVRKAAKELDYQPNMMARALRSNKSRIIGIISEDITTYQVNHIVQGIIQRTDKEKYQTILGDLNLNAKIWHDGIQDYGKVSGFRNEIQEKIDLFRMVGVGGIIYVGMHDRDVTGLLKTDIPTAYAYCYTQNPKDYMVASDNQQIATDIVSAMVNKGHRRIGLVSGPVDSVPAYKRLMGYQTALMTAGIAMDPALVAYGNWSDGSGEMSCRKLMANDDPPTAIFCMNDWMAVGAVKELKQMGLEAGKDVAVTGFDNIDICDYIEPKLTSVSVPLIEIGRTAAQKVIALSEGRDGGSQREELPCRIIERDTFRFPAL